MIITIIIMMMTGATGNALQKKTFTHPCRHWESVTCTELFRFSVPGHVSFFNVAHFL